METQKQLILDYLKRNRKITILEAIYQLGVTRLSAVIYNLKKEGHNIKTETKLVTAKNGRKTSVAEYILEKI